MESLKLLSREKVDSVLADTEGLSWIDSASIDKLKFSVDGESIALELDEKRFVVEDAAFSKAAREIGIPDTYVRKTPARLITDHLNYWYGQRNVENFHLLCRDDTVLGMVRRQVPIVSNIQVLDAVIEGIGEKNVAGYHRVYNSLRTTHINIVGRKMTEPISKDFLFGGVQFQGSVLGECAIEVSAYVFRQICSNGAIAPRTIFRWSRKNVQTQAVDWARDTARQAYEAVDGEFERIKKLTKIKITGHVSELLKSMFHEFSLPTAVRNAILAELVDSGKAETLYDVYNAITKVASHSEIIADKPSSIRQTMLVAGQVVEHSEVCPTCYSVLS